MVYTHQRKCRIIECSISNCWHFNYRAVKYDYLSSGNANSNSNLRISGNCTDNNANSFSESFLRFSSEFLFKQP